MMSEEAAAPRIIPRSEHALSRSDIHTNALKVLYRLHRAGYKAYLVGGGVRDLLLERRPKDFDVVTDARPRQIRRLFRNSRIIGRRFRLAHILFREGVVEVSTFRKLPDPSQQRGSAGDLLVTSDNTFGSPRQDAFRRDFTVNALFYDISDFSLIDYVGGIEDIEDRVIRVIGEPSVRFQEDPVRMLRACEFAGRLGFGIEEVTQRGIYDERREIGRASSARLSEEILQLLRCGHAGRAMQWMLEFGLTEILLPEAHELVAAGERGPGEFSGVLPALDQVVDEGTRPSDIALLALLVLPRLLLRRHDVEGVDQRAMRRSVLRSLAFDILEPLRERFGISAAREKQVVQVLMGFHELCTPPTKGKRRRRILASPSFADSLLVFGILAGATGEGSELLEEWRQLAVRSSRRRSDARKRAPRRRRRRRT